MAKYEVAYAIFRDDVKLADNIIEISLTKKNIQELEEFVVEHNYSPEFVDMPAHIYDKCCEKAWDSVPKLCKSIGEEPTMDIELAFTGWIPTSMIDALSEETRDHVYEKLEEMYPELFEDGDEEDDDEDEVPWIDYPNTLPEKPQTNKDILDIIWYALSDEEKKILQEADDSIEFHHGLGTWIRNVFVYGKQFKDVDIVSLFKDESEMDAEFIRMMPDELSDCIIQALIKYAKEKKD